MAERGLRYLCNGPSVAVKGGRFEHRDISILIFEGTLSWDTAYKSWLAGKNPSEHAGWKRGVYMCEVNTSCTTWQYKW